MGAPRFVWFRLPTAIPFTANKFTLHAAAAAFILDAAAAAFGLALCLDRARDTP